MGWSVAAEATGKVGGKACVLSVPDPEAARTAVVTKDEAAGGEGLVGGRGSENRVWA